MAPSPGACTTRARSRSHCCSSSTAYNSGDGAGNDSRLEIDRFLNVAKGDGSPGSDILNEVGGASGGMSPGSSNGSLTGTSTDLAPAESDDE
ncbi:hypothetical protein [Actinomadura mexicana]|uniref:Uncharacterized protein n=1 Tax=Actinomadura mexicana TaxID=134959 RepID=A0A239HG48_9ACTN|nr:hypothetical protein [Actinomadura mexicana]SNS79234.1 hypothetical protein SAMN06265355_13024 [Actinomadura mexicana]